MYKDRFDDVVINSVSFSGDKSYKQFIKINCIRK
jgi:hypothetical protein